MNQVKQGNFSQSGPRIEPHPQTHGRQGQVDQSDLAPGLHFGLPAGITVVRATLPEEGEVVDRRVDHLTPSDGASALKKGGGSHHQHPSRAARRRAGRGGDTRGGASLRMVATDAGNPCCTASDAAFRVCPGPQRKGLRPLREKRCGCPKSGPLRWTTPHL